MVLDKPNIYIYTVRNQGCPNLNQKITKLSVSACFARVRLPLPVFARFCPLFARFRNGFAHFWPCFARFLPKNAHILPDFARFARFIRFRPNSPGFVRIRPYPVCLVSGIPVRNVMMNWHRFSGHVLTSSHQRLAELESEELPKNALSHFHQFAANSRDIHTFPDSFPNFMLS